jgi:hypothetical protein
MSLYVVPANQEMLWNVINKNVYIHRYFEKLPQDSQHKWFQSIIGIFYTKYKTMTISVNDLHTINRDTIAYMVDDIRRRSQADSEQDHQASLQVAPFSQSPGQPVQITPEIKQNAYQDDYQKRQMEYQQMIDRPAPKGIDFREKSADAAISNMDELIKQHLQQRESDTIEYAAAPSSNVSSPETSVISTERSNSDMVSAEPIKRVVSDQSTLDGQLNEVKGLVSVLTTEIREQKEYMSLMNETLRSLLVKVYDEVYRNKIDQLSADK